MDRRRHARGHVAVDTETTALDEMRAELVGISLCVEPGMPPTSRWPTAPTGTGCSTMTAAADGQIPMADALDALKPLLEDPGILKIGQNMKYDAKILKGYGIRSRRSTTPC